MEYTTHVSLLERLSDGVDPSAWSEFHARYGELIRGFAARQGFHANDCDDVVQEVLLALTKSMSGFVYDPSKGKFRSYLKTLAVRAVFRKLRQESRSSALGEMEPEADDLESDPSEAAAWEDEWQRYHVRRAMQRLQAEFNERDRQAFSYYAVQGRSAVETAESLALSIDQVYQAKSRILRRLTEMIAEQVSDEG